MPKYTSACFFTNTISHNLPLLPNEGENTFCGGEIPLLKFQISIPLAFPAAIATPKAVISLLLCFTTNKL